MQPHKLILVESASHSHTANTIQSLLASAGFTCDQVDIRHITKPNLLDCNAIVIAIPHTDMINWSSELKRLDQHPLLLWCECEDETDISSLNAWIDLFDGIMTPRMRPYEMNYMIQMSMNHHLERKQWQQTKEKLEAQLNDRKWIDIAKGIISKIKGVSETEAYELIRKQAMNERKRIVDVAVSIINVYQLLQEHK